MDNELIDRVFETFGIDPEKLKRKVLAIPSFKMAVSAMEMVLVTSELLPNAKGTD